VDHSIRLERLRREAVVIAGGIIGAAAPEEEGKDGEDQQHAHHGAEHAAAVHLPGRRRSRSSPNTAGLYSCLFSPDSSLPLLTQLLANKKAYSSAQ
jgi:hypothetical protein